MTNIRTIKTKKITRNQYLLDIIRLAKDNIDINEDIEDLLVVGMTRDGRFMTIGQTLTPSNPLTMIGMLDFAKINAYEAIMANQPEYDE